MGVLEGALGVDWNRAGITLLFCLLLYARLGIWLVFPY